MHPIYRSIEPLPFTKIAEPAYVYNHIKTHYQTTPRQNIIQPVIMIGKPSKNGIGLVQAGLSRSSQGSTNSEKTMTSSQQLQISDIIPAIKQLELRVVSLSEAVLHHEQILSQNNKVPESPNSNIIISQMVQEEVQRQSIQLKASRSKETLVPESSLSKQMLIEISNLRQQLSKESKQKTIQQRKYFSDILKKETQSQIMSMYEANRQVFRRIEIDMNELRQLIESYKQSSHQLLETNYLTSNRRFMNPRAIRYREVVDRVETHSALSSPRSLLISEPVVLSQTIYYLDRDNYLLDNSFYYLVDKNGQNVKLGENHIALLRNHNMLD